MPRTRKTYTGAQAAPRPEVAPQTYGEGVEQQQLNEALPVPAGTAPTTPAGGPGAGGTTTAPGAYDHQAALAAAQSLGGQPGLLSAPTTRPGEPITAGMASGPGPGPEALAMVRGTPAGDLMRRLSAALGDPFYAELADRAQA